MRSLKTALLSIRRSPYQSLAAILLVTVTALLLFSLSFAMTGAQLVLQYYESQPQVIAFITLDASSEEIASLSASLRAKSYVKDVSITDQNQALEIYKREYSDSPRLLELVTPQMLPSSFEINATEITQLATIKNDLIGEPIIDEVILQEQVVDTFASITNFVRTVGVIFAGLMVFLSFLIIMIVISMKMQTQRPNLSILRLMGATRSYVKRPYMVEGMIYGFVGGIVGWATVLLTVLYFAPTIQAFIPEVQLYPFSPTFIMYQLLIGVGTCMLIGMLAGQVASSRMIKRI